MECYVEDTSWGAYYDVGSLSDASGLWLYAGSAEYAYDHYAGVGGELLCLLFDLEDEFSCGNEDYDLWFVFWGEFPEVERGE